MRPPMRPPKRMRIPYKILLDGGPKRTRVEPKKTRGPSWPPVAPFPIAGSFSPRNMDGGDALGVVECLRVCPLDDAVCAHICNRAAAVGARRRGMPLYVPFRQAPVQDWATLLPNWRAPESPPASFAPWIKAGALWGLAEPDRRVEDESSVQCHRACEAQQLAQSAQWGLGPLVSTGGAKRAPAGPSDAALVVDADDIFTAIQRYLEDAAEPSAPDSDPGSFRATHIPINGQPVAFRQPLPAPYAPDLAS